MSKKDENTQLRLSHTDEELGFIEFKKPPEVTVTTSEKTKNAIYWRFEEPEEGKYMDVWYKRVKDEREEYEVETHELFIHNGVKWEHFEKRR